ncbi:MAG: DUF499 domain-containing protein [Clostridia bacterium]|nr:MAG: DUF499 domain-containing protein [Clostridia bacterium]
MPAEVREPAYREKIERAYPFHPELIDVLHERWGSFPTFQRTRGVLRLLAQAVAGLYKTRRLKLALLDPDLKYGDQETDRLAKELVQNAGSTFRIYRNTVFILALDAGTFQGLEKQFRRFLALKDIAGDAGIALTAAAREEVQKRLEQAEKDLPFVIPAAYRHLACEQGTAGGERPAMGGGYTYPGETPGGTGVMQGREQQVAPVSGGRPAQPSAAVVKRVAIRAAVPRDKLSQIVGGVIRPLKVLGAEPEITIEIKAEAEGGFDRTTLDSKVKETLLQLGANIAEWKEE